VSPAGKVKEAQLAGAVQAMTDWGLTTKLGKHVFGEHYYFSGTDQERLVDIQSAIDDPGVDLILCARGGYGVTRILQRINLGTLVNQPKWLIGFSDITALHLKLQRINICSVHGPMATSFNKEGSQTSVQALQTLLRYSQLSIEAIDQSNENRSGIGEGQLIGGNLALLVDSLGTDTEVDTLNKILFIEDIGEPLYKIDRMLTQLLRAGKLHHLAGLVVGDFSDLAEGEEPFGSTLQQVVQRVVKPFGYPVGFGFPIGHEPANMPVIEGGIYRLEVSLNHSKLILDHHKI
jgi:muramoyltetrapeptide carboxypeptidase